MHKQLRRKFFPATQFPQGLHHCGRPLLHLQHQLRLGLHEGGFRLLVNHLAGLQEVEAEDEDEVEAGVGPEDEVEPEAEVEAGGAEEEAQEAGGKGEEEDPTLMTRRTQTPDRTILVATFTL